MASTPTPDERIAALEAQIAGLKRQVAELAALVEGAQLLAFIAERLCEPSKFLQ
jgi:N-methylhydantoinase B/oxoprolinase/acetone carboxylase alpha subunit